MSQQRESGEDGRPPREGRFKMDTAVGAFAGAAFQFAGAIILFLLVGQWLDRRLGTSWLAIVGVFVGASAGFYALYRQLMVQQRRDEEKRKRSAGSGSQS